MSNRKLIRDAMAFAIKDITGRVLRDAAIESMIDDFESEIGKRFNWISVGDAKPIKARHNKLGNIEVVGVRIECSSNNNKMYMVKDKSDYFWVYDYETEIF